MGDQLLFTVLAATALLGAALWVALRADRRREGREQRLQGVTTAPPAEVPSIPLRRPRPGGARGIPFLPAVPWAHLRAALAATGNWIGLPQLALAAIVAAVAAVGLTARIMGFNPILVTACAIGAAAAAPIFLLRFAQHRYQRRFLDVFPDALDLIVRAVRAGLPPLEAIETAAREIAAPVGPEFRQVIEDTHIGVEMADALQRAANRIRVQDFRFFVVSMVLQRRTGGGLAETLANLSTLIRQRKTLRMKARALTAESKASAAVISVTPFVAGAGMYLIKPDVMSVLFVDHRGRFMLGVAIVSLLFGIASMNYIIKRTLR
jgi:tight adherence protein B